MRSYQLIRLVPHSCCGSTSLRKKCRGQLLSYGGGGVPIRTWYWSATLLLMTAKLQLALLHSTRWHSCLLLPYMFKFHGNNSLQNLKKLAARTFNFATWNSAVCVLLIYVTVNLYYRHWKLVVDKFRVFLELVYTCKINELCKWLCAYVCYCSFVFV